MKSVMLWLDSLPLEFYVVAFTVLAVGVLYLRNRHSRTRAVDAMRVKGLREVDR